MRTSLVFIFALSFLACSASGGSSTTDASVHSDAPAGFYSLTLRTISVADAGVVSSMTTLQVRDDGNLNYHNGLAPAEARTTDAEHRTLVVFLNTPGVLDELRSPNPCGSKAADTSEYLTVGYVETLPSEKVITGCHQPVYEQLRTLLKELQTAHFDWAVGTCPAPNVWRYQSAGCGTEARPVCGSAVGDGCLGYRCSCDGRDITGCDFSSEPYSYAGFCIGDGGGKG